MVTALLVLESHLNKIVRAVWRAHTLSSALWNQENLANRLPVLERGLRLAASANGSP